MMIGITKNGKLTPMRGSKRKSDFLIRCFKMKRGSSIFIKKEKWEKWGYSHSYNPRIAIHVAAKRGILKGEQFLTSSFKEGWLIFKKKKSQSKRKK